jgi:hypothetical protein
MSIAVITCITWHHQFHRGYRLFRLYHQYLVRELIQYFSASDATAYILFIANRDRFFYIRVG